MHHHGRSLRLFTGDAALVESLSLDPATAPVPARMRAMIDFAIALTKSPSDRSGERVEQLRAAGLDDRAILDVTQVVAYFNFVNRMAEGLGVELEADAAR
ncbi:MAG: peroxidase [Deltaproteobacteria bacterium]|nr:peroxidase [Deltaproteobacteria bacterium]